MSGGRSIGQVITDRPIPNRQVSVGRPGNGPTQRNRGVRFKYLNRPNSFGVTGLSSILEEGLQRRPVLLVFLRRRLLLGRMEGADGRRSCRQQLDAKKQKRKIKVPNSSRHADVEAIGELSLEPNPPPVVIVRVLRARTIRKKHTYTQLSYLSGGPDVHARGRKDRPIFGRVKISTSKYIRFDRSSCSDYIAVLTSRRSPSDCKLKGGFSQAQ